MTLLEDPTPVIFFGILVEAVLGVILLRTGRGVLLGAMAGVLLLVLAGVGLEWLVVTEPERVEATIEGAAAALAANDEQGVKKHIDPSATKTRNLVSWGFRQVAFTDAKVTDLKITVNKLTSPPTAEAHLTGIVWFQGRQADITRNSYPLDPVIKLRLGPQGWLITGYEWENDPRGY